MSKTTLPRAAGAAGILLATAALGSAAVFDGGLTLTMEPHPSPFGPGETATAVAMGTPGDYVLFMLDNSTGPSVLPFKGGIMIGLPQSSGFFTVFSRIGSDGKASVSCTVECENVEFFNVPFYVQALSLTPGTTNTCVSNIESFQWLDDGSCSLEGCTPGYWRQPLHFDSWPAPYTPDTLFSAVFEDAFPGRTLVDVLQDGGGQLDALGRHAVAALLNGASPDTNYYLTDLEVIDAFNAVFPGSDDDYEDLKDEFEFNNELGCPLN